MKEFLVGIVGLVLCVLVVFYLGRWIGIAISLFILVLLIKSLGDFIGRIVTGILEEMFHKQQPSKRR